MALNIVTDRFDSRSGFNIYRISSYSESEEWSTIDISPRQFPKYIENDSLAYEVICSVNGLFCLRCRFQESETEYVLCNPSTDKFQLIPHSDLSYLPCVRHSTRCVPRVYTSGCGLGFVAESQDYKFVRFTRNQHEVRTEFDTHEHGTSWHVAVYSYKNNSWKELPFPFDRENPITPVRPDNVATCVNGFCYWRTRRNVILSFELSSDNFSTLPYPSDIARSPGFNLNKDVFLLELDGSLGLVIQYYLESSETTTTTKLFSFWVYESESSSIYNISSPWTRKTNLDVRLAATKPLWLGKKKNNSLVLLLQGFDGALLEYNYTTTELKTFDQIQHDQDGGMMMMISPYVETNDDDAVDRIRQLPDDIILSILSLQSLKDDDAVDRISQLPGDIILRILSLLSLKEAASTSVLSTRWLHLWRHAPNLVFHDTDLVMLLDKDAYAKRVNSVVELYKAPSVKEFNISLPLDNSIRLHAVTKFLDLAFKRGVKVLVLNLVGTSFGSLEKSFQLKSTNLTSLCLKCLEVSGESISLLLRSSPLLERLIIKYAVLKSDLEVCSGVLKHLDIQYCRGGKSIKGYAPSLTYLRIDSGPKRFRQYEQYAHDPPLICLNSSPLTTLEFTLHFPGIYLEKGFPQMLTLRKLILTYYALLRRGILPLITLLCALPYLEELEIKKEHYICHYYKKLQAANNVERFCHRHLRVFKFTWFDVGDGDHMELMNFILDNCIALEKIVLHKYAADSPSHVAYREYVKQLQSKLPSHIQLIAT